MISLYEIINRSENLVWGYKANQRQMETDTRIIFSLFISHDLEVFP